MIISRKKFQQAIKEAAYNAEAETALKMHEKQRREDEERRIAEQFREIRERLDKLEARPTRPSAFEFVPCERGKHERF